MNTDPGTLELGNYRVLHKEDQSLWMLGRGGYGTTYKAEHKHLGRICALKVINDNLMQDNEAKRRFLQEAQAAALLDHPHIASIHDFGESNGIFYYAMTYCAGGDLQEFSKARGPQPWSVVRALALQLLPALGMAHAKGLLHRDLKPSNIMLADDDGMVSLRLIDFGLVKVIAHHEAASTNLMLTQDGAFLGNPLTASPEQLREEELDERSDLFSLGVTLWYLLVGGSPFGEVSTASLVHQRLSADSYEAMLPENLEPEGRQVLARMLAKDKGDRFSVAEEIIQVLTGESVSSDGRDKEPAVVAAATPTDWSEIWEIQEQLKKFTYGTYYACRGKVSGIPGTTLFVPDSESPYLDSVCKHADKILNADTHLLSAFYQKGVMAGEVAYVAPPFLSGTFQSMLQVVGSLSLQKHRAVLQQIASAVDESMACDIPGVELDVGDLLIGLRGSDPEAPQSADEWERYFQNEKDEGAGCDENLEITVFPRLVDSVDIEEAMVTLSGDDLAANPVARFGGLLYRSISGMSVKQTAYLSPSAHVSTSNLSEESNRYLSEVISATRVPDSAMHLLGQLCEIEGAGWGTSALEATLIAKDQQRSAVTQSHSSLGIQGMRVADLLPKPTGKVLPDLSEEPILEPEPVPAPAALATPAPSPVADKPVSAPPQPKREEIRKKSAKGKLLVIAALVLICAALAGGLGWWFLGKDNKSERKSRHQDGGGSNPVVVVESPVTLEFGNLVVGRSVLPDGAAFSIKDKQGELLANLEIKGKKAEATNIPAALFASQERWPLVLELSAKGFAMPTIELSKRAFSSAGDDRKLYASTLELLPRPYLEIEPKVYFNNREIKGFTQMIAKGLKPFDLSVEWLVEESEGKIAITLPLGEKFPFKANLLIDNLKDKELSLVGGGEIRVDLELDSRQVHFMGLGEFDKMQFKPDYSKIKNASVRRLVSESPGEYKASASAFKKGAGSWVLPSLEGEVSVSKVDWLWNFQLSKMVTWKVLSPSRNAPEKATPEFLKRLKLAEQGDRDAQHNVAMNFLKGDGVTEDAVASLGWFQAAASQKEQRAQHNLGMAYEFGNGTEKDMGTAVIWYAKGAKNGYSKSYCALGWCYYTGQGVPRSYQRAEENYLKAVKKGSSQGMFNLAILYSDSQAGMIDEKKTIALYTKAADQGHPVALFNLACYYSNGDGGVAMDRKKAIELCKKSAEKGYGPAKNFLKQLGE